MRQTRPRRVPRPRGPCQPQLLEAPQRRGASPTEGKGTLRGSRLRPPRSPCTLSPTGPTLDCAAGVPLQLQRPLRFQWSRFQSQRTGASGRNLARTAPGTLSESRFYPIWNPPTGGGLTTGEDGRSTSREKRATAGDQRPELSGTVLKGAKADPGRRDKWATHAACAPPWSPGRMPGSVLESDSD